MNGTWGEWKQIHLFHCRNGPKWWELRSPAQKVLSRPQSVLSRLPLADQVFIIPIPSLIFILILIPIKFSYFKNLFLNQSKNNIFNSLSGPVDTYTKVLKHQRVILCIMYNFLNIQLYFVNSLHAFTWIYLFYLHRCPEILLTSSVPYETQLLAPYPTSWILKNVYSWNVSNLN